MRQDPYERASFIPKLQKTRTVVLSDQDGTNTVNSSDVHSAQELEDRKNAEAIQIEKGVTTGSVSARTRGLMLSEKARLASLAHGFDEPEPRWAKDASGRYAYIDPAKVAFFRHSLDRDVSAGFGSGILLRNGSGYMVDWEYDHFLNYDYIKGDTPGSPEPWRLALFAALIDVSPEFEEHLSPIDRSSNYEKGLTNVAPLKYRVQFDFRGAEGLERMRRLKRLIEEEAVKGNRLMQRVATVDESHPNRADPEKSRYTLYLIPWGAQKERMINWLVGRSAKAAGLKTCDLRIFYAGDTLTDLRAGLYGGGDAETTFLLATGSRVAPYILERQAMFGNESLDFLWSSIKRPADRLRPTGERGVYTFSLSANYFKKPNRIVIGDERYPGLTPPGSVHAFLKEFL
jgi:hypothetical protein